MPGTQEDKVSRLTREQEAVLARETVLSLSYSRSSLQERISANREPETACIYLLLNLSIPTH